ncbi:MAG: helix-turn-helix domain-containing protein [Sediminicola sp.]|tara:strand:+ start:429 stop:704 length:276 start_codon:yes stop_codon:yes gene_type:complete
MPATIVTTEDLLEFKFQILEEIRELVRAKEKTERQWLKSQEVRELLQISAGTLQNLRINGVLPYTKMGGRIYYAQADIHKVLQENRVHNKD